jgi:adenylate kinase
MLNVGFLGVAGSGKGTQAALAAETFGLVPFSSGAELRRHIEEGTPIGLKAKSFMKAGKLVPDAVCLDILDMFRASHPGQGLALDGFPRSLHQAEELDRRIDGVDVVFLIDLTEEEALRRLQDRMICPGCQATYGRSIDQPQQENICDLCGKKIQPREDDIDAAAIRKRFTEFAEFGPLLIDYYQNSGRLRVIDGSPLPEEIARQVARHIRELVS